MLTSSSFKFIVSNIFFSDLHYHTSQHFVSQYHTKRSLPLHLYTILVEDQESKYITERYKPYGK